KMDICHYVRRRARGPRCIADHPAANTCCQCYQLDTRPASAGSLPTVRAEPNSTDRCNIEHEGIGKEYTASKYAPIPPPQDRARIGITGFHACFRSRPRKDKRGVDLISDALP